jgi:hypothetical protein
MTLGFSPCAASATDVGAAEVTLDVFADAFLGVVEAATGTAGLFADALVIGELTAATAAGQR